ncbi:hypothetical protein Q5P01_025700 [Channa striata]|uniref:Glycosyl hydrolases family 22 (GH22) domain-containing protein n=1 Tax=Channa striata TaxID=64152 RepID=A0AA88J2C1_CHASR|nr:hypothetical protein Q5P01_025700 [Channa striata]
MKLGLLVVLAVAASVPSLSEGRIVSKCELREKLDRAISLPRKLQKYKENILATVICELNSRSRLNTGLVNVFGNRKTTTARPTTQTTTTTTEATTTTTTEPTTTTTEPTTTTLEPTTTEPTTTTITETTTEATTTEPTTTTTEPTTTEPTTTTLEPTTTEPTTTTITETTTEATTTEPTTTTTEPTTTEPTTTEPTTTEPTTTTTTETTTEPTTTTTEPTTTEPTTTTTEPTTTTTEPTTAEPTTTATTETTTEPTTTTITETTTETTTMETTTETTTPLVRRKRDVRPNKKETESLDRSLKELLKKVEDEFDEKELEEDNKRTGNEDKDGKEGWKRNRGEPWTLGLYGIFQLSDSHFCDSGYRWSRNECRTDCSAFIDDDITDDIACLVKTNYWWHLLRTASPSCFNTWNFFKGCK